MTQLSTDSPTDQSKKQRTSLLSEGQLPHPNIQVERLQSEMAEASGGECKAKILVWKESYVDHSGPFWPILATVFGPTEDELSLQICA